MKKILSLSFLASLVSVACGQAIDADYNVVPQPESIIANPGEAFVLNPYTVITYESGLETEAEFLAAYIAEMTGLKLELSSKSPRRHYIKLEISGQGKAESYTLAVTSNAAIVSGADAAGVFHGIQTLRKSLPLSVPGQTLNVNLNPVTIKDQPRFAYRGLHFDSCRHFFSVSFIKKYIDLMALHNMNFFHWHLTEDQGWRVEIKKYPLLTTVGAYRDGTMVGKDWNSNDGIRYGGFYTQEELREIVAYAAARHIQIVPEVDLPGHMLGALAAYPELGCTGGPYKVSHTWGVFDDVLCAGNEKTYTFLADVLSEFVDIFPGEYFHIGGDECPKTRWKKCPECQAKIKALGIKGTAKHSAEDQLQSHVMEYVCNFLKSKGKKVIGWDELLEGGGVSDAIVMSWRGESGGVKGATTGHDVIMTPNTHFYFDYGQSLEPGEPLCIGGFLPVKKVYEYEPLTGQLAKDAEAAAHIIGVQANLWTEYISTIDYAEYMCIPRVDALSEVQWTSGASKDYKGFLSRMKHQREIYDRLGYNYAKHIFEE